MDGRGHRLRVIRQQRRYQRRPRRHRLDLGQKSVSASLLLLVDELCVGERGLLHGCQEGIEDVIVPVQDVGRAAASSNQCFPGYSTIRAHSPLFWRTAHKLIQL